MQRHRVAGRALIGDHGCERAGCRIHVTGAQVVEAGGGVVPLPLEVESVAAGSGLEKVVSHLSRSRVLWCHPAEGRSSNVSHPVFIILGKARSRWDRTGSSGSHRLSRG